MLFLNRYYAKEIRNSFGLAFDPLTGNLSDSENGSSYGDEVILVKPEFNGSHKLLDGFLERINHNEGNFVKGI
jgi:hypothetical protein